MGTLLVLTFDNELGAQEMVVNVTTLQKQQKITLSDAALVIRTQDGRIKVKQANNLVGAGAFGGAFWGLLIGQLFWQPWSNVVNEENNLPIVQKVAEYGLDADFVQNVKTAVQPGCSALFLMVASKIEEQMLALFGEGKTLWRMQLGSKEEMRLREAFGVV